jgi:hypothetical protein
MGPFGCMDSTRCNPPEDRHVSLLCQCLQKKKRKKRKQNIKDKKAKGDLETLRYGPSGFPLVLNMVIPALPCCK